MASGQTIDLSSVGSQYNLNGGILQVGSTTLVGTSGQGTLNFGGGTLQVTTPGAFTNALDGVLTGTSTIDAATMPGVTSFVQAGNLSGAGGIVFSGTSGTAFQFSGANTYTGATTILGGTLDSSLSDVASSSALNIGSGGVLNLTTSTAGVNTYNGNIGNANAAAGTFNINFSTVNDTLEIAGTNTFTGVTTLGANGNKGTLQVFSGNLVNVGEVAPGSSVLVGGDNAVATSGTVVFGTNSYTGSTTISSGFTALAGDIGAHHAFNGNVVVNGTLAANSPLGSVKNVPTLTIDGTLQSTGNLVIRMNGANADLFQVNANATSNVSGHVTVVNGSGTGTYTIINTNAPGDLMVGAITTNPSTPLFEVTITPDNSNPALVQKLILTTVQNSFTDFAQTPNQRAAAMALDPLAQTPSPAFVPVLAAFNNLSGSQISTALNQVTPESLQYARNIAFENSTFLVQRVNNAMANLREGYAGLDTSAVGVITPGFNSGLGRSLGSLLAYNSPYHPTAPNGVNYYPQDDLTVPETSSSSPSPTADSNGRTISDSPQPLHTSFAPNIRTPVFSEFVGGDVILADLNQNSGTSKASYTAGDAIAGVSFRMTSNLSVGVLFDYNHTDAKTDGYGSKTKVDSYSPGIYGTYSNHNFYINGLFSFGYNNYSNDRSMPLLGTSAKSSPSGQQYVSNLDVGYDFHPDPHWTAGPTLGLTYTHLNIDSFTESGAGPLDLSVNSQSADSLRSRLGGHVAYQTHTGNILFQPNVTAMWQHEYLDQNNGITSEFQSSAPFTIQTASNGKDSALLGLGVTATLDNSMSLYLNYIANVGTDNFFAQTVMGGIKASF